MPFPLVPLDAFVEPKTGLPTRAFKAFVQAVRDVLRGSPQGRWIQWGEGAPENVVTGPVGCFWVRVNGGASTTLYIKETGTGNTGWRAV